MRLPDHKMALITSGCVAMRLAEHEMALITSGVCARAGADEVAGVQANLGEIDCEEMITEIVRKVANDAGSVGLTAAVGISHRDDCSCKPMLAYSCSGGSP